ncbi:MAG: hypothetical protein R2852_06985 [Bacteroidia bacterium]
MIKLKFVALVFIALSLFSVSSCKKEKDKGDVVLEYTIPFIEKMEIDVDNIDSFIERESYSFPTQFDDDLQRTTQTNLKSNPLNSKNWRIQVIDYAYAEIPLIIRILKDIS